MQPPARQPEVGADELGTEQGGSRCPDIGEDLLGGGTIGPTIWVRDISPDTSYAEGAGQIPLKGGPQTDGEATAEVTGRRLGLSPSGGCNGGDRVKGNGDLPLSPPEHCGTIYCN